MVMYLILYIVLTLPLAAGRIASVNGHAPSVTYFCVAGALMTLSGLCDTLQYSLTRKNVVLESKARSKREEGYYDLSASGLKGSDHGNLYFMKSENEGPIYTVCIAYLNSNSTDTNFDRV